MAILQFGRNWFKVRLRRHAYILWSPLTPVEVSLRLSQNLTPAKLLAVGFVGSAVEVQGVVPTWSVSVSHRSGFRNSGRFIFRGLVGAGERGTWLTGDVGPDLFAPVFSIIWFSFVTLFLVAGLIGLITDLATDHGTVYLPLVLFPAAMLCFFVVLIEVMTRFATTEWKSTDRWLRNLLEGRDNP